MPSAYISRQKKLQFAGEFLLFSQGRNSLLRISNLSSLQKFSALGGGSNLFLKLGSGCSTSIRVDSCVIDQRKAISVIGILSRTFATRFLPDPSGQVCQNHINHTFLESSQLYCRAPIYRKTMAGSSSVFGRAELAAQNINMNWKNGQMLGFTKGTDLSCISQRLDCFRKTSASLKNSETYSNTIFCRYLWSNAVGKSWNLSPFVGPGTRDFQASCPAQHSAEAAPDVSFKGSGKGEKLDNSSISSSGPNVSGDRLLKMHSASCYLPHPDKEETGGEDAHFICVNEQAIGVADGVGGWAEVGVDAGQYSRELMSHSVSAIQEEPKLSIDPAKVLEKAHSSTKAKGSSTACIITLTAQGIHAVNLGDSGFMVIRDGCTIFRSPVQQHDFNFTYQLESGNCSDLPSAAQVFNFPVASGDVIVAGTDGLFDNLYNNEIVAAVVHGIRAGLGPQVTAQKIAALARQHAQDKNRQTPFSSAAQEAGYRYSGGKLDDITVVVSYIASSNA